MLTFDLYQSIIRKRMEVKSWRTDFVTIRDETGLKRNRLGQTSEREQA
jgi:hypothetical protein